MAPMATFDDLPCLLRASKGGSGCELRVHVLPGASRSKFAGLHGDQLRVRVAAPPIDGRANAELLQWLAHALDLRRRAVTLRAGLASRHKRVHLDCAPAHVAAWLRAQALGADRSSP